MDARHHNFGLKFLNLPFIGDCGSHLVPLAAESCENMGVSIPDHGCLKQLGHDSAGTPGGSPVY